MARYEALRQWRTRKAAERGVEPDVVMTNSTLMALAKANPADSETLAAAGLLGAWKMSAYGEEIIAAMRRVNGGSGADKASGDRG